MKRNRAYRRVQAERKKNKFRKILKKRYFRFLPITEEEFHKQIGRMSTTPKANKCQCCCNPRHSSWYTEDEKLTMQERRAKREAEYAITEYVSIQSVNS